MYRIVMNWMRWKITSLVLLALAVSSYTDSLVPGDADQAPMASLAAGPSQGDDGLRMRQSLRSRADTTVQRLVEENGNIVAVAFRPTSLPRGVSERGMSLLPSDVTASHVNHVSRMARVLHVFHELPAMIVEVSNPAVAVQLRHLPWVDYVLPNTALLSADVQGGCTPIQTSGQTVPWNITRVRANLTWTQATGTNGSILVLDNGRDLSGSFPNGYQEWPVGGTSYGAAGIGNPTGSHGTPVMSVAVVRNNNMGIVGVAPEAVLDKGDITGDGATTAWQNAAAWIINVAVAGTKVISISYSSKLTSLPPDFVLLHDAILNAYHQRGIIIVASTGNQQSSTIQSYPARWDEVIGVGGSGHGDEYVLNNYAPGNVEIAAPAVDVGVICMGGGTQGTLDGTSFATPQVAGAVMLLREIAETASPTQIRNWLTASAVPMANSQQSGAGRLDVYGAALLAQPPPPPTLAASISGTTRIQVKATYTWEAMPSGGSGSYSYQWKLLYDGSSNWQTLGTAKTQQLTVFAGEPDFQLRVTVVSGTQSVNPTITVQNCISGCGVEF